MYNIIGKKYNRLTVLAEVERTKFNKRQFICICDCGVEKKVVGASLFNNHTQSCGCLRNERTTASAKIRLTTIHGLSSHPLYNVWIDIKRRCYNNKVSSYKNYGGRGIKMCDTWKGDFKLFYDWCIKNNWEQGLEVDRYPNNDGDYEPSNCRLATSKENCNNTRRNVFITVGGITKTITQWSEETGMDRHCIATRVRKGLSGNKAIFGKLVK